MASDDLKDIFKNAADIAKQVPKHLQEAAFNRALDVLLSKQSSDGQGPPKSSNQKKATPNKKKGTVDRTRSAPQEEKIDSIDRTAYPDLSKAPRVLDRALILLAACHNDYGVDGLSAPKIAEVLTNKFRLKTSRRAVSFALDAASTYVDRTKSGRSVIYRIMAPGLDYVAAEKWKSTTASKSQKQSRSKSPNKPSSTKSQVNSKTGKKVKTKKKTIATRKGAGSATSRLGPMTALKLLIDKGFFNTERTIVDIIEHLDKRKGYRFKPNELSTQLLRLVRRDVLLREKQGESGQYEYKVR